MKIYATKVKKEPYQMTQLSDMTAVLDKDRKEKIEHIRREEDRLRSIYAGLLLRYSFLQEGFQQSDWEKISIERGKFGKPSIAGITDFHYSLSHSGDWVVCSVGKKETGVDIQKQGTYKLQVAKRFFSTQEYERLLREEDSKKQKLAFYKMWAAKESFVKLTGRGIGGGINACVIDENYRHVTDGNDYKESALIRIYENIDNYIVCGCTWEEEFPEELELISFDTLMGVKAYEQE